MRPSVDAYFARIARVVASRSTCLRRAVGCVLVDARKHILATGYNGVATGQPHCNEVIAALDETFGPLYPHACAGAREASGTAIDACGAIHAEQNALLQCRDVYAIETCYVTTQPCVSCLKLLLATSCRRIIYLEPYVTSLDLWTRAGRIATMLDEEVTL